MRLITSKHIKRVLCLSEHTSSPDMCKRIRTCTFQQGDTRQLLGTDLLTGNDYHTFLVSFRLDCTTRLHRPQTNTTLGMEGTAFLFTKMFQAHRHNPDVRSQWWYVQA